MVKFTQALLVAALVAGPALALGEEFSSRDVNPAEAEMALSAREVAALFERGRRQGGASQGGRKPSKRRGGRGGKGRRGKKRRGGRGKKELQAAAGEAAGAGADAAAGAAAETLTARQVLAAVEPEFEEREVTELLERSPIFRKIFRGIKKVGGSLLGRDVEGIEDLTTRDLVELDIRAPIFGKIFRGAKRVVGGLFGRELQGDDAAGITAREVEELFEREPIFGKIFRGVKRIGGAIFGREIDIHEFAQMAERGFEGLEELATRELEADAAESMSARQVLAAVEPEFEEREVAELLERSPIFRKIFRGIKRVGGSLLGRDIDDIDDLTTRDFVELDVRAPIFGKIFRGAKRVVGGLFGRELEGEEFGEITAREIEELYEREPIFGKIFRGIKRVGGSLLGRDIDTQEFAQVAGRGFEDFSDEIYERELSSIDDLEAREPFFWLAAKALSKVVRHKRSLEDLDDFLEARYFDDVDYLEARYPDEELLEARRLLGPLNRPFGWRGIKPRTGLSRRSYFEDIDELD